MPCIELKATAKATTKPATRRLAGAVLGLLLAACATAPVPPAARPPVVLMPPPLPAPEPAPMPAPQAAPPARLDPAAPVAPRAPRYVELPPPKTPRSLDELRLQLARRLVAAHPDTSYLEPAPERLWAIPVLEVELNADGTVRRIEVLRRPTTGDEATALAIAAVRRAAPYGDVSRLPRPWKVVETFLFDDDLRFKPRTLD